jgi:hypothetical protein
MDTHLVAVWAHCLGAAVMASATTTSASAASGATTATTPLAAFSAIAFGHGRKESRVLFHDDVELLVLGTDFHA